MYSSEKFLPQFLLSNLTQHIHHNLLHTHNNDFAVKGL